MVWYMRMYVDRVSSFPLFFTFLFIRIYLGVLDNEAPDIYGHSQDSYQNLCKRCVFLIDSSRLFFFSTVYPFCVWGFNIDSHILFIFRSVYVSVFF